MKMEANLNVIPDIHDNVSRESRPLPELLPLVSVIITTYGECSGLSRAIDSVLRQDYGNIELIVVDDNGNCGEFREPTEAIMRNYESVGVAYIKHRENKNGSAARNTGISYARGTYVSFLDNDDFMLTKRVSNAVRQLEESSASAAFCDVLLISKGMLSRVYRLDKPYLTWKDLLYSSECMGTGSNIFLRRSALNDTGLFDTSFRRNQDVEYMLRFLLRHESVCIHSLDLVKSESGTSNEQTYDAYVQTKRHFDEKFKDVIAMLDKDEETRRLVGREQELLFRAIRDGNLSKAEISLSKLKELGHSVSRASEMLTRARCKKGRALVLVEMLVRKARHLKVLNQLKPSVRKEIETLASCEP